MEQLKLICLFGYRWRWPRLAFAANAAAVSAVGLLLHGVLLRVVPSWPPIVIALGTLVVTLGGWMVVVWRWRVSPTIAMVAEVQTLRREIEQLFEQEQRSLNELMLATADYDLVAEGGFVDPERAERLRVAQAAAQKATTAVEFAQLTLTTQMEQRAGRYGRHVRRVVADEIARYQEDPPPAE